MSSERMYSPRVVESRRAVPGWVITGLAVAFSALWWIVILGFIFWPSTGPH